MLSNGQRRQSAPGLLPLFQALVAGQSRFELDSLPPADVARALENGFGPILARVTRDAAARGSVPEAILAADLTSRVMTADMLDALTDLLRLSAEAGCHPVLMKGCATCLQYYPEPHLRTMGDLDLLVGSDEWLRIEPLLRADGFEDTHGTLPRSWYEGHHHSVPLWHPQRRIWIELHTRLYPPWSPLAAEERLSPKAINESLTPIELGGQEVRVFNHELQLVYTATRWAQMPSLQRGAFPILDLALLIAMHGGTLDWQRTCAMVDGTWGATALRLMLTYLDRWELARVPAPVLLHLARQDRFTNRAAIAVLHGLITTFVIEGRPLGRVISSRNWRTAWSTIVGPSSPWTKPFRLAAGIAFPVSERDTFSGPRVHRRVWAAMRGRRSETDPSGS